MRRAFLFITMFVSLAAKSCTGFLVYPRILQSSTDDNALLVHIHEDLTLNLQKSSLLTREFFITSSAGPDFDSEVVNGAELEENLYHDSEHKASVHINQLEDGLEVRGLLSHDMSIAPLARAMRSDDGAILHQVVNLQERRKALLKELFITEKKCEELAAPLVTCVISY
ncbi:uncharacterized protein LOC144103507 [Amblyomma americanum]